MASIKSFLCTDDNSLCDVKSVLFTGERHVSWFDLGLVLGLYYGTLKDIQCDACSNVERCRKEMLGAWLKQQDGVRQQGFPSWRSLTRTLAHPLVNQKRLGEEITRKHKKVWCIVVINRINSYILLSRISNAVHSNSPNANTRSIVPLYHRN